MLFISSKFYSLYHQSPFHFLKVLCLSLHVSLQSMGHYYQATECSTCRSCYVCALAFACAAAFLARWIAAILLRVYFLFLPLPNSICL